MNSKQFSRTIKISIFILPFVILIGFIILYHTNRFAFENQIAGGEQLVENIQFPLYGIAAIILGVASWRLHKLKSHWHIVSLTALISVTSAFITFEEIAWGQKLFGFETPEAVEQVNFQGEFTIHNLEIIQTSFVLSGAFLLFTGFFTFLPLITKSKIFQHIRISATPLVVIPYFALNFIYNIGTAIINPVFNIGPNEWIFKVRDQEILEMILAIGVFLYAVFVYRQVQKPNQSK